MKYLTIMKIRNKEDLLKLQIRGISLYPTFRDS